MTVEELAGGLVAIDSVNPALVPGGAGEAELAGYIVGWANDQGLEAKVVEATPGRPSVIVTARGRGGGRSLLLCGAREQPSQLMKQAEFERHVGAENICPSISDALARAANLYGKAYVQRSAAGIEVLSEK